MGAGVCLAVCVLPSTGKSAWGRPGGVSERRPEGGCRWLGKRGACCAYRMAVLGRACRAESAGDVLVRTRTLFSWKTCRVKNCRALRPSCMNSLPSLQQGHALTHAAKSHAGEQVACHRQACHGSVSGTFVVTSSGDAQDKPSRSCWIRRIQKAKTRRDTPVKWRRSRACQ